LKNAAIYQYAKYIQFVTVSWRQLMELQVDSYFTWLNKIPWMLS